MLKQVKVDIFNNCKTYYLWHHWENYIWIVCKSQTGKSEQRNNDDCIDAYIDDERVSKISELLAINTSLTTLLLTRVNKCFLVVENEWIMSQLFFFRKHNRIWRSKEGVWIFSLKFYFDETEFWTWRLKKKYLDVPTSIRRFFFRWLPWNWR